MEALVYRVGMAHPGDVSEVMRLIDDGRVPVEGIVAILGKTEGNGCVNDFTRGYATQALKQALAARLGTHPESLDQRIAFVMSGGTEGGLSPHFLVFARQAGPAAAVDEAPALALGAAVTRAFLPEEIGTPIQVEATAEAVAAAIADARVARPEDVHYVQVKCPLLTRERIAAAAGRGKSCATEDTYHSMALSRGASALGVAVALGEIARSAVAPWSIGEDVALYSRRAATSAGIELMHNAVLVAGVSRAWSGSLTIAHEVMGDAIDLPALHRVLTTLGLPAGRQLTTAESQRLVAVLAKAEPARSGQIRGARHTMLDDSDINATRHARALVGGVLAGTLGVTALFVSGGAEHQGPDGGGPVAIIARRA